VRLDLAAPAEGRDLDILAAEKDVRQTEAPTNQARIAEQIAHLLRMGRGAEVEVLGPAVKHQVPHAAAHQVGHMARVNQAIKNLQYVGVDIATRDRMRGALENAWFHLVKPCSGRDCLRYRPCRSPSPIFATSCLELSHELAHMRAR
jgi:hypothetical protein